MPPSNYALMTPWGVLLLKACLPRLLKSASLLFHSFFFRNGSRSLLKPERSYSVMINNSCLDRKMNLFGKWDREVSLRLKSLRWKVGFH
ncbi:hypothetical protein NPIL_68311 [Nephila pilipes]|uniref:Secreted protein n=1 Tax=Nephila pilipes TaxID=299642 RepID=A0A8X6QJY7_NEPPI|nr:hypothetical protein NPIL_68311 [Nephila pilipes]